MPLEVRKKERETTQSLIRRFTKNVQQSGILLQARKIKFKKRKKSDTAKKRAALRKVMLKKEYEKMEKMGNPKEK
jgi:ribosomal protein S21